MAEGLSLGWMAYVEHNKSCLKKNSKRLNIGVRRKEAAWSACQLFLFISWLVHKKINRKWIETYKLK